MSDRLKKWLGVSLGAGRGHATGAFAAARKSLRESIASAPPELRRLAFRILAAALALFALVGGYRVAAYYWEARRLEQEIAAGPRVRVAKVAKGGGARQIVAIGETRPFESATLYAKVSGYLKKVLVDKGDVVTQGQVLALIESPETDEAYLAAEADAKNKRAIWSRVRSLFEKNLVSQQEADQAQADAEVANAKLRSQATLKGYETLSAPFAGTITARYADPGALVQNAMNSETSALPVAMISQVNRLRVDVFLDQRDAPFVSKNDPVEISLAERPGFKISGQLSRLSGELDSRTKMLLAEIDIPNDDGGLLAGSFVRVALQVRSPPYLQAPVEAMAVKDNKTYLTTIGPGNVLAYKPIEVASNDGKMIEIGSGTQEGEILALSVGDSLPEGTKVRPIEDAAAQKPAGGVEPGSKQK
jgi:RND family efflux transporter MFP subunit